MRCCNRFYYVIEPEDKYLFRIFSKRGQIYSWLITSLADLKAASRTLPSATKIPLKLNEVAAETQEDKHVPENEPK